MPVLTKRHCIRHRCGWKQLHKHAGKKICFGASWYVVRYDAGPTAQLLKIVRQHGPDPLQDTTRSGVAAHMMKYQDMLRQFPRSWLLHPDHKKESKRKVELTGQVASKYVSTWVQRKHMCSQLQATWPPGAEVDVQWLRAWCPDSKCRLGDYEGSMRLNVFEMQAGCPYYELSMWSAWRGP